MFRLEKWQIEYILGVSELKISEKSLKNDQKRAKNGQKSLKKPKI